MSIGIMRLFSVFGSVALLAFLAVGCGNEDDEKATAGDEANQTADCKRDLRKGAIVMMSGGGFDGANPPEVRARMDAYLDAVNAAEVVNRCSGGQGMTYKLVPDQQGKHVHQTKWQKLCDVLAERNSTPIVIAGHSNGGAAAISLSRCLEGKGKTVDLLITADSVATGNDLGDVYTVPSNVKVNVNTFLVPNVFTFLIPFPFGRANKRAANDTKPTINVGMEYLLPGAIAHRNAFYDFAGGDQSSTGTFSRPFALLDLTLAYLGGATDEEMSTLSLDKAKGISTAARIKVKYDGPNTRIEIPRPQ
jgi:hypothetical protein